MTKRYETYKDSGVEWIGDIPEHWNTSQYKFVAKVQNGFAFKSQLFDKNFGFPILRIRDITSGEISTFYKGQYSDEYIIRKDDLLIGMDGDFNIRWWDKEDILLNQRCCRIVSTLKSIKRFLYYSLPFNLQIINDLTYYTTVKHLSSGDINNAKLPLPTLEEQTQIANYLDHKTSLIDNIIAQKEQLIDKLKEQRQALINEAVTKGLNPNAPLKDSGIEWLGEIPEHWEVMTFRRISDLQQGLQIPISERHLEEVEGALEYITTKSIHNPNDYRQYVVGAKKNVTCIEADVLLGRTGNTGEVVTGVNGVFHNNFFKVNFDKERIEKNFIVYFLKSTLIQELIMLAAGTTTIPDLNHGDFLNLPFLLPPLEEQRSLLKILEVGLLANEKCRNATIDSIKKLKEYRQSIISEAVTGKIDVRDWKPKIA